MPVTQSVTAKQVAVALKGLAGKGLEVEAEAAREIVAAKGATAAAGTKAMVAGGGAKGAGMAAGAKAAGVKAAGATVTGVKAAGATATGATTAGAKTASAGGFLSVGKGLGLGLGLAFWGPVILGVVGAAAIYGYVRSRRAENAQSDEEVDLADALSEV